MATRDEESRGWLGTFSRFSVWVGGGVLVCTAVLVTVDILMRKLLGQGLRGTDELSGYALAVVTVWALPYALLERANIRIDLLYPKRHPRLAAVLNLFALASLAGFAAILVVFCGKVFLDSFANGSLSATTLKMPLMYPQSLWVTGLVVWLAVLLVQLGRTLLAVWRGDLQRVGQIAGMDTPDDIL